MSEFWLVDQIRSRVFLVALPGMTRRRERDLVKSFRKMTRSARASGVPLGEAWSAVGGFVERLASRLRSEQERETFIAIMQRLRQELMAEYVYVKR
jgi:phosphoglycolate phosphatase-like HAD superfamily hydrolase